MLLIRDLQAAVRAFDCLARSHPYAHAIVFASVRAQLQHANIPPHLLSHDLSI